jgi:hypothetical protein
MGKAVTTESGDATMGSVVLYGAGLLVFVLGVLALARLGLTEAQLILGVLACICASVQMIVLGMLVDVRGRLREREADRR